MIALDFAGQSNPGRVRSENQDRWVADPKQDLFLVADGMGGTAGGKLAADIVAEVLPRLIQQRLPASADPASPAAVKQVVDALAEVSERLHAASLERVGVQGMGSTAVLALVRNGKALIVHLGDSRAYLLHAQRLSQLTRDHSLAQELLDHGAIAENDVPSHFSTRLTRFVGMEGKSVPEARIVQLAPGDRLLLCSDGLSQPLGAQRLGEIASRQGTPAEICQSLVAAANEAGGADNITVVLVAVSPSSNTAANGGCQSQEERHDLRGQVPRLRA